MSIRFEKLSLTAVILLVALSGRGGAQGVNISLVGHLDPFNGNNRYADVWGEGDLACIGSFDGFGVGIIDISNPAAPFLASWYNPNTNNLYCYQLEDIQIKNRIGYFASNAGNGLHVVNLTNPAAPVLLSRIASAQGGHDYVHNVFVDGNYVYTSDSRTTTLKVFNVSNPAVPVYVRDIVVTNSGFIHDITVVSNRLYASGWGGQTYIYDVTSVATQAPALLGTVPTGGASHSAWVTADGKTLASCAEYGARDLRLFDISNPANPILRSAITSATLGIDAVTPHNPIIMGKFLFVSWYQAGVQVFDISDPAQPWLVGSFDTFPGGQATLGGVCSGGFCFDGNWGVYPLLGFNKVLVSDMDGGLSILDASGITNSPLSLRINDATVRESDCRPTNALFQVRLSRPSPVPVSVDYATADRPVSIYGTNGNANAWSDYAPTNGTLIFNPGETNKTISVTIFDNGEPDDPSEGFFVNLSNYTNVALVIPQAIGTILDRGAPCTLKLTAIGV